MVQAAMMKKPNRRSALIPLLMVTGRGRRQSNVCLVAMNLNLTYQIRGARDLPLSWVGAEAGNIGAT